jgi:hypothetical protein|tara:strand:+ start:2992 stop:3579 length:588 start_codon:yes stop_codon:yes gene_type:complete
MARKIKATTDNSGWVEPKVRKKRKPMTEKQRQAAAERLVKVREKRVEKNPDYGLSGVHESLRNLPDEHHAHPKKVKQWIKTQKELVAEERRAVKQNIKGAYARQSSHEGYVRNLLRYLRDGDYVDDFYGEYQEKRTTKRCLAQSYYWYGPKKGEPQFSVGVYYPLLGAVYTEEMYNEDRDIISTPEKKIGKRKRK